MIEVNGIYKLKIIKGLKADESNYKVIAEFEDNLVVCEKMDGYMAGSRCGFLKDFLIDPDKPDDIYAPFNLVKKGGNDD